MLNIPTHVTWWRHYMTTPSVLLVLHEGYPLVTLKSYTTNGRVAGNLIRCDSTALYWWGTCWSMPNDALITNLGIANNYVTSIRHWCEILIAQQLLWQIVDAPVSIFQESPVAEKTSRETDLHPQHPPILTLYEISLPVYVIVTNKRLQLLTTTW